jgi:hypothetical protein
MGRCSSKPDAEEYCKRVLQRHSSPVRINWSELSELSPSSMRPPSGPTWTAKPFQYATWTAYPENILVPIPEEPEVLPEGHPSLTRS